MPEDNLDFESAFKSIQEGASSGLKGAMTVAADTTPDAQASVMGLAQSTGLPADIVARNKDYISKQNSVRSIDYDALIRDNPRSAKYLSDPNYAALHRDEISSLTGIEDAAREHSFFSNAKHAINSGAINAVKILEYAPEGLFSAAGSGVDVVNKVLNFPLEIIDSAAGSAFPGGGIPGYKPGDLKITVPQYEPGDKQKAVRESLRQKLKLELDQAPALSRSALKEIKNGNFAKAGETIALQAIQSAPLTVALIGAAATGVGSGAAGLALTGVGTAGQHFDESSESGASPEMRRLSANLNGAFEAGFESVEMILPLKGWASALTKEVGRDSASAVIKAYLKTIAHTAGTESIGEGLTSYFQDISDYLTGVNPEAMNGALERAVNAGAVGAVSGAAISSPGSALLAKARLDSVASTNTLDNLSAKYVSMKEAEKLPGATQSFTEKALAGTTTENIIVDIKSFERLYQDSPEIVSKLGIQAAIEEAKITGELVIPTSVVLEHLAGTPEFNDLKQDFRFEGQTHSANELKAEEEHLKEQVAAVESEASIAAKAEKINPSAVAEKTLVDKLKELSGFAPKLGGPLAAKDTGALFRSVLESVAKLARVEPGKILQEHPLALAAVDQEPTAITGRHAEMLPIVEPVEPGASETLFQEGIDKIKEPGIVELSPSEIEANEAYATENAKEFYRRVEQDRTAQVESYLDTVRDHPDFEQIQDEVSNRPRVDFITDENGIKRTVIVSRGGERRVSGRRGFYAVVPSLFDVVEAERSAREAEAIEALDPNSATYEQDKEEIKNRPRVDRVPDGKGGFNTFIVKRGEDRRGKQTDSSNRGDGGVRAVPGGPGLGQAQTGRGPISPSDRRGDGGGRTTVQKIADRIKSTLGISGGPEQVKVKPSKQTLYQRDVTSEFYQNLRELVAKKMSDGDPASKLYSEGTKVNKKTGKEEPFVSGIFSEAKAEELEWSGLKDYLKTKENFTKEEILSYISANQTALIEYVLGGEIDEDAVMEIADKMRDEWVDRRMDRDFESPYTVDTLDSGEFVVTENNYGTAKKYDTEEKAQDAADELNSGYEQEYRESLYNDAPDFRDEAMEELGITDGGNVKHPSYVEPGGDEYREVIIAGKFPDNPLVAELKEKEEALYSEYITLKESRRQLERDNPTGEVSADRPHGDRIQPIVNEILAAESLEDDAFAAYERAVAEVRKLKRRPYTGGHWDQPDAILHYRITSRKWSLETAKEKFPNLYEKALARGKSHVIIFFVEEIQSDLHQEGRAEGYAGEEKYSYDDEEAAREKLSKAAPDAIFVLADLDRLGFDNDTEALLAVAQNEDFAERWDVTDPEQKRVLTEWRKAKLEYQAIKNHRAEVKTSSVPNTPFKKTWVDLALKRIVRQAAEEGADAVFWANGNMNARRYPNELRKVVDTLEWSGRNEESPNKLFRGRMNDAIKIQFEVSPEGLIISSDGNLNGKQFHEAVGKEMAATILSSDDAGEIGAADFVVGGTGMRKHYDEIVPSRVKGLFGKYGVKVESVPMGGVKEGAQGESGRAIVTEKGGVYTVSRNNFRDLPTHIIHTRDIEEAYSHADRINNVEGRVMVDGETTIEPIPVAAPTPESEMVMGFELTPELKDVAIRVGFPMFQGNEVTPRGQVTREGLKHIVEIFNTADASTPAHEIMGHYFLKVIQNLHGKENAAPGIRELGDKILKEFKIDKFEDMNAGHEEKFSKGFETYLFEGKAPNEELRSVFAHFKIWFLEIYKKLQNMVSISDEMREIYSLMLTAQDASARAESQLGLEPLFRTAADADMTDAQFMAYQKAVGEGRQYADEKITAQLLKKFKSKEKREYQEKRNVIRLEVKKQIDGLPVYKAFENLESNQTPDTPLKLNRSDVPAEMQKTIPNSVMANEGGMHPDVIASILGYESGRKLMGDLAHMMPKESLIDEITDKRMIEEHPDLVQGGELTQVAIDANHNDRVAYRLRLELEYMAAHNMPVLKAGIRRVARRPPAQETVTAQAKSIIGGKSVKDIKPKFYLQAEIRYAREAGKLFAKGDFDGAFEAKLKELLNHELYRQANEAKSIFKKAMTKFKKISGPDEAIAKTREMDLVNAARAVMAEFGIGKKNKSAEEYLAPIERYDPDKYVTMKELVDFATQNSASYKVVPFNNFVDMADAVDALWDLAQRDKSIEINGKLMSRDVAIANLNLAILAVSSPKEKEKYAHTATTWDKVKMSLLGIKSALRRTESWVDSMDKGDGRGAFHTFMWNEIKDGTNTYRVERVKYFTRFKSLVESIEPALTFDPINSDELGFVFKTKVELLGAMLHRGNPSNFSKLLRGYNWGSLNEDGSLDSSKWNAFEKRMISEGVLTKADYDFLQSVWDLLEETKKSAQTAHKQMYGSYFSEVTAEEFTNEFGTYRGGYMPAVADPFANPDARIRNEKEQLERQNNSFMFPTSGRGFTKKRSEGYARPLMLDLRATPSHIDKVLRFTHIEPHVKDAGRILWDRGFRESLDKYDQTVVGDMLVPWLQRAAQQTVETPTGSGGKGIDTIFRYIRKNTGMQIMVGSVVNALQQLPGLSISALKVRPRYLRDAAWAYFRHPNLVSDDIKSKSVFMSNKIDASFIEIQNDINEIILNKGAYQTAKAFAMRHGYFLQRSIQSCVDTITWSGAYDQAVDKGLDEKEAVREADSAVRLTQGSFDPEDISRFEGGTPFVRSFTMFYNYFGMQANTLGTEFKKVIRDMGLKKGYGRGLYVYSLGLMVPAVVGGLIVALAKADLDADDDGEYLNDIMNIFFGSQFNAVTSMLPGVGPVIRSGVNALNDKWYDDKITASPAINMLESAGRVLSGAAFTDGFKKGSRDVLTTIGMLSGLPIAPLAKPIGYLSDVSEGKAQPTGPVDFARGLAVGK